MEPTKIVRIKVCCIGSEEEMFRAVECGASCVGLVSRMPSGPGVIEDEAIRRIAARVPPGVSSFLLTCSQDAASIIEEQRRAGVNTLQLVDRLETGTYDDLRAALPGIAIVQVIHVTGPDSLDEAIAVAPHVNAILLDSGNPSLSVKELGGTGRVHDWAVSRAIREAIDVPLFLAGGLRPDNVAEAVRQVRPFGVDVCSGVRTGARLDPVKLAAFVEAAR
ncbi:MAG TPA: phosphoribosylanthranilate isomerase [Armatimonadota bacterium]